MSGRSSPAEIIHDYLRERENFVMESVTPYPQLTNPQCQEEELFLTPGPSPNQAVAIPYADANYPSPVQQVQYYPEFSPAQGMDQPPLHSLQVPVHPGYTEAPSSPCEDDSAFYSSSPHSSVSYASPAGSPIPCPATSQQYYPSCTLPDSMTAMCNSIDHPASSLPLTCSSIPSFEELTKPVYTASQMGFYPAIQNTSGWGMPPCAETFMLPDNSCNLPRHTSHTAVLTDTEHHIQYIDTNSPSHTLDFYPPTPESPESRQHCHGIHDCPNLNQQYDFTSPHIIPGMNFVTSPSPKIPIKHGRGRIQRKAPKPPVQVDDSEIKDIPTSAQLWEFTLRVLKKPKYSYMVSWENKKDGLFRFGDAQAFAALWGKHRNRPSMTYDKVARALRYYYKRDILNQVGGRLTYKFSKRLGKLYATE